MKNIVASLSVALFLASVASALSTADTLAILRQYSLTAAASSPAKPNHHKIRIGFDSKNPSDLFVTQNTLEHSSQHYPTERITSLESAAKWARADRETSILDGDDALVKALQVMMKDGIAYQLDKKAQELINKDSDTVAYQSQVQIDQKGPTTFLIVFCRHESCDDDAHGVQRKGVFKKNEILSIYPICGPDVKRISRGTSIKSAPPGSSLAKFVKTAACKL